MQKIKYRNIFILLLGLLLLISCTSKKQEALNQLENFTEDVEENGASWNAEQWKQKYDVFVQIRSDIYKYKYSDEERAEISRLEGRCISAMANHASGGMLKKLKDFGTELGGSLNGLLEGIDNSSESDN
jgi:hypothetical protein